ncbi:translation initiation inhibitor [Janthinobacterium sp. Marseille]|uniref:Rid family detoxifying hydrolase n=1 Tax=Herminiimonas aquatilis TaxID=345342 RepID=A0ABW2J5F2_9BURK|nr:Rid family detoxifying hydrolase [Janthinobacterium sp. Marseille]ABR90157.1 translation initiation inhibitor [Janthinobacterium sp. Marseille]
MTNKITISTPDAPPAVGPYAQGTQALGFAFCSGQLPINPETGAVPEGVEAQTRQSLSNVAAVLAAAGASMDDVLKTTVFLKDMNDFPLMNAIYATYFPGDPPARSTIEVARLPKDVLVEVEAIALAKLKGV